MRRGRRPKAPEERHSYYMKVRVTTDMADALFRLARRRRLPVSVLIRDALTSLISVVQKNGLEPPAPTL